MKTNNNNKNTVILVSKDLQKRALVSQEHDSVGDATFSNIHENDDTLPKKEGNIHRIYRHNKKAVILINTGSITKLDEKEYIRFVRDFLDDPFVLKAPFFVKFYIRRFAVKKRAPKVLAAYYQTFQDDKHPYFEFTKSLVHKLYQSLNADRDKDSKDGDDNEIKVFACHNYLGCDIDTKLYRDGLYNTKTLVQLLMQHGFREQNLIFIPLMPQHVPAMTLASANKVKKTFLECYKKYNCFALAHEFYYANIKVVSAFYQNKLYINALANTVKKYAQAGYHIIFSYHSSLKNSGNISDTYHNDCRLTTELVASKLALAKDKYSHCYHSYLGNPDLYLEPFLDETITDVIELKHYKIAVICPSFCIDCLETLYDVNIKERYFFETHFKVITDNLTIRKAKNVCDFKYITALNDSDDFVLCLKDIATKYFMI